MSIACPLCSSTNTEIVYRVSASDAAQNWILRQNEPTRHAALAEHIEKLWNRDFAYSMDCRTCSFGFADPFVAGDSEFYEMAFGPSDYPKDKWEFRKTLAALGPLPSNTGKALEIGSGYGYFLNQISPAFFPSSAITALEYNPTARGMLQARGYRVLSSDLLDLAESGEKFSAIFMFQVLEHRDHPHETFGAFAQLLSPGGHLFIAVPNPLSIRFWEANGSFIDVPPNHIGLWRARNLEEMAARHGFTVREIAEEPFSLTTFIKWDSLFSYVRRAQLGSFPASFLYSRRRSALGRAANLLALLALTPLRVPVWVKAKRSAEAIRPHIWAHLVRAS
jgi:SAM-dependent methyltransferase